MASSPLTIDRCVCHQRRFDELLAVARRHGCDTLDALQAHAAFGDGCTLCHPYVRRMLKTDETVFHEVISD